MSCRGCRRPSGPSRHRAGRFGLMDRARSQEPSKRRVSPGMDRRSLMVTWLRAQSLRRGASGSNWAGKSRVSLSGSAAFRPVRPNPVCTANHPVPLIPARGLPSSRAMANADLARAERRPNSITTPRRNLMLSLPIPRRPAFCLLLPAAGLLLTGFAAGSDGREIQSHLDRRILPDGLPLREA
jgi:hypothetical protein